MKRQAFTLIELLVVIVVVALLVAAATVSMDGAQRSGRDATRLSDVALIASSVDKIALAAGGTPPDNGSQRCASSISGLSASMFPNGVFPTDPAPYDTSPGTCADASRGYFYVAGTGDAVTMKRTYAFEVGLENDKNADESQFQAPSELGVTGKDTLGSGLRHVYVLPGLSKY